jgi:hypothetical protein
MPNSYRLHTKRKDGIIHVENRAQVAVLTVQIGVVRMDGKEETLKATLGPGAVRDLQVGPLLRKGNEYDKVHVVGTWASKTQAKGQAASPRGFDRYL